MTQEDKLHFKTNVQLKSIIGKDLINDDNIAILELVKNSFDADAKKVTITFLNLKSNDDGTAENKSYSSNTSRIIICDDGLGMDIDGIRDKWLNIAYSEKKTNTRQHNRRMAGAKGVGRFSCDRLGEYLILYAKVKDKDDYIQLKINWNEFELDNAIDQEIQSIPLDYNILSSQQYRQLGLPIINQGVVLEIIKLRSRWVYEEKDSGGNHKVWDVNKFIELKKYLEKLINPNQAFEENDFGIYLDAPEFTSENDSLPLFNKFIGKVENRIFEKLDFKSTSIESEIIEDGKVLSTELKDKGEIIFRIKEKNEFYPLIKNAKIFLYYLNPYAKAFFTKQTGIRSVDYGSIFLFINGFRVPPYGELGNDWLGIDQRKAQGYARYIGLREYVGRIEILDSNNDFQIISSREGIVRNENYFALTEQEGNKSYFYKTLRRLERYVVEGLAWDSSAFEPSDPRFREIEKKIIAGKNTDEDLQFRENNTIKRRRVYELIHSIVSAKPENVIELYINEELITEKVNEEKEKSEKEFIQLIEDFENKKIDPDTLNRILLQKAKHNKEIEKQLSDFAKFSTSELTSKAILNLQEYKYSIEEQEKTIKKLKAELEATEKQRLLAEQKAEEASSEITKIRAELTETKSQNLFLKSIKSQEFDDVLNLMHHIGISTGTIQNYITGVVYKLDNDLELGPSELKKIFSKINYEMNKIYSISKFATKANFKVTTKDTPLDVISFIEQYLLNIVKPFLPTSVNLVVFEHDLGEFIIEFKPIELTIILDNLVNNSRKANSEKIEVSFKKISEKTLQISFKDYGSGIKQEIQKRIFDYGFTTTDGSGLGLTHIKELITKIGGDISLNTEYSPGAEFIITLNQK